MNELGRYIPVAGAFGGMLLGALVTACEMFGISGFGFALVASIATIFQYYEIVAKEYGGNLAQLLGEVA